jgi:hypothetical protein
MEGPLFYEKRDSVNYMVYFGTSLGESMIYYSDTKEWDYRLRGMGEDKYKKPRKFRGFFIPHLLKHLKGHPLIFSYR